MWSVPAADQGLIAGEEDFNVGMDAITELRLVQGTYNGKGNTVEGQSYVGVDSRALSKYMPSMLDTVMLHMEKNATEKKPMTIINPSALPYITINATKELNLRTKQLESKIQQLEDVETRMNQLQLQMNELEQKLNGLNGGNTPSTVTKEVKNEFLELEEQATLYQNFPNPVSSRTTIPYYIPEDVSDAKIIISNMLGQQVKQIPLERKGKSEVTLNLKVSPSAYGTYTYTLITDGQIMVAKNMILTQ